MVICKKWIDISYPFLNISYIYNICTTIKNNGIVTIERIVLKQTVFIASK